MGVRRGAHGLSLVTWWPWGPGESLSLSGVPFPHLREQVSNTEGYGLNAERPSGAIGTGLVSEGAVRRADGK